MRRPILATALAALALPAVAQAHTASVVCNPAGGYTGIADYQQFHPAFTITPPTATVRWDDGFRLVVPLPSGCVPQTPAAPPVVETPPVEPALEGPPSVAPAPSPPVVVTPGAVEPQPRKRVTPRRVTCMWLNRVKAGPREYTKRGWYWRCKAPVARKVPFPGVTG